MPRGDGTGPSGKGPMTGRGLGRCSGKVAPGADLPQAGVGRGRGRVSDDAGRGRGAGAGAGRRAGGDRGNRG